MDNSYTFFVISNINTAHTKITPDQRFLQTLETFQSIRKKVPSARILFADNSQEPITENQVNIIGSMVDAYVEYENNLFTKHVNSNGSNKGLNEMLVYEKLLNVAIEKNMIGKRIFKISGRYKLSDSFDIWEYELPKYLNKYVFTITHWLYNPTRPVGTGEGDVTKFFLNTALWSMCSTLVDNYRNLVPTIFNHMINTGENIEISHLSHIPKDKLITVPKIHGHGFITNGEYTSF